ncbi:olfactory receptor 12D3-like [Dasypus novemcinctus]|uniref:olfactory receptor 12D3-like n=1 Tax=Dasypus novemcinctus TaxID=9361 RepID=UPI00265D7AC2|nr:olfactory receptor 12D3-like [Dasypus novemcinctus]
MEYVTAVNEFLLLGQTNVQELQPLSVVFSIIYWVDLFGNGAIFVIVILEPKLHSPMYFFLGNLSSLDIEYSSVTLPKALFNLLSTCKAISFIGCITQLHFFHFLGGTEAILLAFLGFDHFMAICYPLRYSNIMNSQVCALLAAVAWLTSFLYVQIHSVMTACLNFCGSQKFNHIFCDVKPLLEMAYHDTLLNQQLLSIVMGSIAMRTFLLTLLSYVYAIGFLLLKSQSCSVLHKALSTCASHFVVVGLFYGPVGFTYIHLASASSVTQDHVVAITYGTVTPVLNPLIYTLRNKAVMLALRRTFMRRCLSKDC